MIILPAIDLKGGCCVRLKQGRADDSKVYAEDPVEMAKAWEAQGGQYLHVVDLDGAFSGKPAHTEVISKIVAAIDMPVEVGGGIRTDEDIKALLDCGVDRVILGTRAFSSPDSLKALVEEFAAGIAVGIDAKDGFVAVKGWVEETEMLALDLAKLADESGVQTIIYTDISTDGMMQGTNVPAMRNVCEKVKCNVVASGGITTVEDVQALKALAQPNLIGAIVGKALYEGTVTLKELVQTC